MSENFNVANSVKVGEVSLININSMQMMFALMHMDLAKEHKNNAKGLIEQVKANQDKSKEYATLISDINAVLGTDDGESAQKSRATKLASLKDRCVDLGIPSDSSYFSGKTSLAEGQKLVQSLQGLQEEYGTKNQTIMVQIQDMLGQYNANLHGANSAVQQSNNVLQSLAKAG